MHSKDMKLLKRKNIGALPLFFFVAVFGLGGCLPNPPAVGDVNQIIVLADDNMWNHVGNTLKEVFERIVETPQPEKIFRINRPFLEDYEFYKKQHSIILVGTLESGGLIGKLINENLTQDNRISVVAGEQFAFQYRNPWAANQYMLILVAPTLPELIEKIIDNGDQLFDLMDQAANNYMKDSMFRYNEQFDVADLLRKKYDFTLRVQHDYFMKELPEINTVILRRFEPDRVIVINWIDTSDVDYIPDSWAVKRRSAISDTVFDGRIMNMKTITVSRKKFIDYDVVELSGLWLDPVQMIGGPMINYTFFDEFTSRIYMIDLAVFAPDLVGEKEPFIRQLKIIAGTFSTRLPENN